MDSPFVLGLFLVLSLSASAGSSPASGIASATVGECVLTVEANESQRTLRLRAHHPKYRTCQIDRGSVVSVLATALSGDDLPKVEGGFSSLSIGRLIDFPWLSEALATTAMRDRGWDSSHGKPTAVDINKYVARVISGMEIVMELDAVLEKVGYRVAGVSVEKVLVGGLREVPSYQGAQRPGRVPFDAQVWFRLGRGPR